MPKVLVACIGNIFLGDDGFGVEVARRLMARQAEGGALPEGVRVVDFGIRGLDLAFAFMDPIDPIDPNDPMERAAGVDSMRRWDHVVLVDAMAYGAAPGDISVIEPDLASLEQAAGGAVLDPHGMHPLNVLRMVRQMGATLPPLTLLACQPQECSGECGGENGHLGLTPAVEAAVPVALQTLDRLLARLLAESAKLPTGRSQFAGQFPTEENRS